MSAFISSQTGAPLRRRSMMVAGIAAAAVFVTTGAASGAVHVRRAWGSNPGDCRRHALPDRGHPSPHPSEEPRGAPGSPVAGHANGP